MANITSPRALLIILDGFGRGKESPFNAISNAKMPFYRHLLKIYPHSQLLTHGEAVGLPEGIMGNSEVGHMTMGAGRIVYQDLTRISKSIRDGSFFENKILRKTIECGAKKTGRVHLMGLVSDGGVHSTIEHLLSLIDFCVKAKVPNVSVHVFLDGRDTPPNSGINYMRSLLNHEAFSAAGMGATHAHVATVMGRYWAMDRDKRWERVEKAYHALTGQAEVAPPGADPVSVIEKSYLAGKTDEFVEPVLLSKEHAIHSDDSVIFFNFRSDRAREISEALTAASFAHFDRGHAPMLSSFSGMTVYDRNLNLAAAFLPQNLDHLFGSWLEEHGLSQFRIAETEKYAHVTFFFNGGKEAPFKTEERVLIQSPKEVPTYDLKPEMSAFAVATEAVKRIESRKYDFILMNLANADMVGHTGNYEAAIKAMETLDRCLEQVIGAAEKNGYNVLLTADHGNAEEMRDCSGQIHTQHTLNPVPLIWVAPGTAIASSNSHQALGDGGLADIMPTLCDLMKLPLPPEATGKSLVNKHRL